MRLHTHTHITGLDYWPQCRAETKHACSAYSLNFQLLPQPVHTGHTSYIEVKGHMHYLIGTHIAIECFLCFNKGCSLVVFKITTLLIF